MALLSLIAFVVVAAVMIILKRSERARQPRFAKDVRPLPGPKGLPVIGSVADLPKKNTWLKLHEWSQQYGPIYQVNLAGTNHVWICRDNIARDLLAKRSGIYSDRPFIPALERDNRTSGQYLPLMSKNEAWTRQRKFAKQIMDVSERAAYYGYPELESIRLLFELITDPSKYNTSMESFIARVTSRLAWGTSESSDELKQRARELLIGVSPNGALGNRLPLVMSLPEKMAKARAWELRRMRTERQFFETMQKEVQDDIDQTRDFQRSAEPMLNATPRAPSWTRMFLENKSQWKFASDLEGAYAVGMHGMAGALTTAAPMQSFCLAMCHFPQYQALLHEEVDRVLGDRMPTLSDMPDMPVLRAFIRETMRWRPPVPTGIPHELTQDDIYEGYHIPAGSVMHPLEWSISRDPEVFPDPDAWNPLRWLDPKFPTYQEPLSKYPTITNYSQFGYGRRTCQGMGVTEANLFVGFASVAWLFSIQSNDAEAKAADVQTKQPRDESYFAQKPGRVEEFSPATQSTGLVTPSEDVETQHRLDQDEPAHAASTISMHAKNDSAVSIPGKVSTLQGEGWPMTPPETPLQHPTMSAMVQERPRTPRLPSTPSVSRTLAVPNVPDPTMNFSTLPTTPSVSPSLVAGAKDANAPDPTMDFSTLLIAKPLPFKFSLRVRDRARAELVTSKWLQLKMDGEFHEPRVYWSGGKSTAGDEECGWGEVFM